MTTDLAIRKPNSVDLVFGTSGDLKAFAQRIKLLCKGGEKLTDNEAMALAQVATVTHLNPFIGEVWYIPGKGPMVGIAGARHVDQEGTSGYSTVTHYSCSPEEAGATEAELKDVVAAFRAEISDSAATLDYQRMFTETLKSLRESGVADPVAVAREICGPRPMWIGWGYSKKSEQSQMNKTQLARKRAEADGLKKKIVIPFGGTVAETDVSPDYVEAQPEPAQKRSEAENMHDIGYEEGEVKPITQAAETPAVQLFKYNSPEIVGLVAKAMQYNTKEASEVVYQAFKSKTIGNALTLEEAKLFCESLTKPA